MADSQNGHPGRFYGSTFRPPPSPILAQIDRELLPLIKGELEELAQNQKLPRDQKIMRLAALKAMTGSRVSGFIKGMDLYARLKGALPDEDAVRSRSKKRVLDELDEQDQAPQ